MPLNVETSLFGVGALIGFVTAVAGAMLDYFLLLRHGRGPVRRVPGCIFYVMGGLTLAGIVALVASWVLTGGLRSAFVMGLGVFITFYLTFAVLFGLWLLLDSRRGPLQASEAVQTASAAAQSPAQSASAPQK